MKTKEDIITYYSKQRKAGKQPKREVIAMLLDIGMGSMAAAVQAYKIERDYNQRKTN